MYPPHMTSKATRWFEAQSGGSTDSMGVNISPAGTEEGHVEDEEDQECQAEAPSKNHKTNLNMGVSKNRGTPKSSILIGCSLLNHPFWGTPIFGNAHIFNNDEPSICQASEGHCFVRKLSGTSIAIPALPFYLQLRPKVI